jgi:hypothetical protein
MRWLVEVSSLGNVDKQSFFVDAESWQRALQEARAKRGEGGSMSGFSIELLDDGCRAVDPTKKLKFTVTRANDGGGGRSHEKQGEKQGDKPSEKPGDKSVRRSGRPSQHPKGDKRDRSDKASAKPSPPRPGSPSSAPRPASASPKAPNPPASSATPPVPVSKPAHAAPPRPSATPAPPSASSGSRPAPASSPATPPSAAAPSAASSTASPPIPKPPLPPTAVGAAPVVVLDPSVAAKEPAPILEAQVLFRRNQEPDARAPLTYRELVLAVPAGTTEDAAARVLQEEFAAIEKTLEAAPKGKLVHLAAFDYVFEGRPPTAPLAVLTWKDWRGAPVVGFPRRPDYVAPSTSGHPPPMSVPPSAPVVAAPPPAPPVIAAPPPPPPPPPAPSPPAAAAAATPAPTPTPAPAASAPPPPPPAPPAVAAAPPPAPPPPASAGKTPAPPALVVPQAPPTGFGSGSKGRTRRAGDELIAELFEEMHDLHFLRDAIEGAAFCLSVALDKLPSRAGLVHFYNVEKRTYFIAAAQGAGADALLLKKEAEGDPVLAPVMRSRRASALPTPPNEARGLERYAKIGAGASVVVAPVVLSGRALAAIELVAPIDGEPFNDADAHALAYIGEQYAEFLSQRGLIFDEKMVARLSAARG